MATNMTIAKRESASPGFLWVCPKGPDYEIHRSKGIQSRTSQQPVEELINDAHLAGIDVYDYLILKGVSIEEVVTKKNCFNGQTKAGAIIGNGEPTFKSVLEVPDSIQSNLDEKPSDGMLAIFSNYLTDSDSDDRGSPTHHALDSPVEKSDLETTTDRIGSKGLKSQNFHNNSEESPSEGITVRRGTYCHLCRSKPKPELHCSQCSKGFCKRCLSVRHGEDSLEESGPGLKWICPKCRRGCGPGCEALCCTCSTCLHLKARSKGLKSSDPWATRAPITAAQSAGFNLHDYLIHLETGESKEEIANRKSSRGWTKAGGSGTNCYTANDGKGKPRVRKTGPASLACPQRD
ncbi:unnamed protein product [Calypogeia fissa]